MIEIYTAPADLASNAQGEFAFRHHLWLELSSRRAVFGSTHAAANAVDVDVFHGHAMEWSIAPQSEDVQASIADEVRADLAVLCDEYDTVWDGSNNVATWKDAARAEAAIERIESVVAGYSQVNEVNQQWITDSCVAGVEAVAATLDERIARAGAEVPEAVFAREDDEDLFAVSVMLPGDNEDERYIVEYADARTAEVLDDDPVATLIEHALERLVRS